jgi:hypothetical protein
MLYCKLYCVIRCVVLVSIVLNKLGVYPKGKHLPRLKTLEVGAINTQLQKYPGLDVRAIDINSQVLSNNLSHIYITHTLLLE